MFGIESSYKLNDPSYRLYLAKEISANPQSQYTHYDLVNTSYLINELKLDYKKASCFFVKNYFAVNSMTVSLISSYNTSIALDKLENTFGKIDNRNITIIKGIAPYDGDYIGQVVRF